MDRRGGAERRGRRRACRPAAGAHADHDGQQHHQPAGHRAARLAGVRRAPERHGGGAAGRPVGLLRADDVRDARPVSARRRADREAHAACGRRPSRGQRDRSRARARRRSAPTRTARGHVGLLPRRRGPRASSSRRSATGPHSGEALHRWVLRHPNVVFVGGVDRGHPRGALAASSGSPARGARPRGRRCCCCALHSRERHRGQRREPARHGASCRRGFSPSSTSASDGVPAEYRTAVVVPTLFGSVEAVREALDHLEVQFLANREAHLHFALLSDFTDSPTETRGDGRGDLAAAVEGVHALNARYAARDRRRLLSLPPAAAMESEAGRVDGVGAQARQARASSTASCAAARTTRSRRSWATSAAPRACGTSSRSTPTPCSRPTRRRSSSARWRIRSTAPCTTRRADA